MNRWLLSALLSLGVNSLQAQERLPIITDTPLELVAEGRAVVKDTNLFRHYEGLKHFARGRQLELQERIPEALQAYQMASQFDGQAVDLIRHMLPLCFKLQQTASALKLMRQSLAIEAQQADLWMRYAQELYDLERHQEVLKTVEQAFKTVDFKNYPAFAAELHFIRASSLDALKQYPQAVASYQEALKLVQDRNRFLEDPFSPTLEEMPGEEAKLLERLARACLKAKQWDASMQAFKDAQAIVPVGNDRLELNLAEVYLAAGKPEAALIHLQKAVEHKPSGDEAYRLFVTAMQQSGRGEEVIFTLERMHLEAPEHTAIDYVLAEQYVTRKRYDEAEKLYREIFTVEQAGFKEAVLGYFKLLIAQNKTNEVLVEYDHLLRQPTRASWARAAVLAFLAEPALLQQVMAQSNSVTLQNKTRMSLVKLAIQAELWPIAETQTRDLLKSEPKPTELYLLLARTLLEQNKYVELTEVCQAACDHPGVAQPLIFHVETAKAFARLKNVAACQKAITAAKELVAPNTTDQHKVLCTELYTQHLLGQHQMCITQATELLKTSLAQGPWGRQVRYILAHALEATSQYDPANAQYNAILQQDPNDGEAMAAQSRCLLFQNTDLARAESVIRAAIELDLIDKKQRQRLSPVPIPKETNPVYQATLGTILLRVGKAPEGIEQLQELAARKLKPDPWVLLCIGDACLMQRQNEQARERWQQALELLPHSASMGTDLTDSLQTRLKRVVSVVIPASAVSVSSTAKP